MEPGRELDALVAEKVMGWKRDGMSWIDTDGEIRYYEASKYEPSTSIAAAWEVVEAMRMRGFSLNLNQVIHADGSNEWYVQVQFFKNPKGYNPGGYEPAAAAPHAICLAALKALGTG
jgi:hypothetical protein